MATRTTAGVRMIDAGADLDPGGRAFGRFDFPGDARLDGIEVEIEVELATGRMVSFLAEGGLGRRVIQAIPTGACQRRLVAGVDEVMARAAAGLPVPMTTEGADGRQEVAGVGQADTQMQSLLAASAEDRRPRRPGPSGPSDLDKALLARAYVLEVVEGGLKVTDFAKARGYSPYTISNRISGLRAEGYLPRLQAGETNPGKPWGRLTNKTRGVIAAAREGED